MVRGYEDGFDDLEADCVVAGEASLDVNSGWCCGRHDQVLTSNDRTRGETVSALFLRRPWHDDEE